MQFSHKRKAKIVQKTVQNAINLADIRHDIQPDRLRIQRAFVGKGKYVKRMRMMGKGKGTVYHVLVEVLCVIGRHGIMHHKYAHLTVVLEETPAPASVQETS